MDQSFALFHSKCILIFTVKKERKKEKVGKLEFATTIQIWKYVFLCLFFDGFEGIKNGNRKVFGQIDSGSLWSGIIWADFYGKMNNLDDLSRLNMIIIKLNVNLVEEGNEQTKGKG